jgi:hypothetical protein
MERHLISRSVCVAVLLGAVSLLSVSAQQQPAAAAQPTARMPDGHPDLNGFWMNPVKTSADGADTGPEQVQHEATRASDGSLLFDFAGPNNAQLPRRQQTNQPHYKPEYAAKVNDIADHMYGGSTNLDPMVACKPLGVPRGGFGTMEIAQTPKVIALLFEEPQNDRLIYTDGRQHPKDLDTSFMGDSIGHWEGDTLVVDVAGLNDETWYAGGVNSDMTHSTIHSDKEHVTERWTVKGNLITYQATVEDPVMLAEPWVINPRRVQRASSDDYLMQFNCITNDVGHIIQPSATDKFICVFCRPESDYGGTDNSLSTGQTATNPNK